MLVYVVNRQGRPLMPCSPRKARTLLKQGKAKVIKRTPFTIQLLYGSSGYKQKINLGLDVGSQIIGCSAVREDGKVFFKAEIKTRFSNSKLDLRKLLSQRREYRRGRRYRKTRYRKTRFDNRKRAEGWLAPSLKHLVYEHIKTAELVKKILPINKAVVEINSFDIHKIINPEVSGSEYQNGPQKNFENVKMYVRARDRYECQICSTTNTMLEVHHIISKPKGSDQPDNLITLCTKCHDKCHEQTANGKRLSEFLVKKAKENQFRASTHVNTIKEGIVEKLKQRLPTEITYGYITKKKREGLGLEKSHANDAVAIAIEHAAKLKDTNMLFTGRFVRRKNRQLHRANPKKQSVRRHANTNRYLVNKQGVRFQKYDLVKYTTKNNKNILGFINTLRSCKTVRIANVNGEELYDGATINKLLKLQNGDSLLLVPQFLSAINNGVPLR